MACGKGCNCSSCTPSVVSCEKPITLGVEDINFGCGTEDQIRGCNKVTITQVNSEHIIYCGSGKPVEAYIDDLRRMFPYIECDIGRPTMDYAIWADAQITSDVESCAIGLPDELVQRIPFQEGDVASHNDCLWISLVNSNLTEPTEATQDEEKWLCLSSIDNKFDQLFECCGNVKDRLTLLEACIFPEGSESLCDTVSLLKACIFPEGSESICDRVGLLEEATDNNTFITAFNRVEQELTITRNDGVTFTVPLPDTAASDTQTTYSRVTGTVVLPSMAVNGTSEGTLMSLPSKPENGLIDVTASVTCSLLCNSAHPSSAVDCYVRILLGGVDYTGWQRITRIHRYNPAAGITKAQSHSIRAVMGSSAGQVVSVQVRSVARGIEGSSGPTFTGQITGTFKG